MIETMGTYEPRSMHDSVSLESTCGEWTVHCLEVVRVELFIFNKAFTPAIHAVARVIDLARDLKKDRRKPLFYFDSVLCR